MKNRSNRIRTKYERIGSALIHLLFIFICILMLYPFLHVIMGSFMKYQEYFDKYLFIWVDDPTLDAYRIVLEGGKFTQALKVTIGVAFFGTLISMFFTSIAAYGLSKTFPGQKIVMGMIVLTMFFSGSRRPSGLRKTR